MAGVYPEIVEGLTLVRSVPSRQELSSIKGVRVFFSEDPKIRRSLEDAGFSTADAKLLKRVSDIYYLNKREFDKIKVNQNVSLEKIVGEYRSRNLK